MATWSCDACRREAEQRQAATGRELRFLSARGSSTRHSLPHGCSWLRAPSSLVDDCVLIACTPQHQAASRLMSQRAVPLANLPSVAVSSEHPSRIPPIHPCRCLLSSRARLLHTRAAHGAQEGRAHALPLHLASISLSGGWCLVRGRHAAVILAARWWWRWGAHLCHQVVLATAEEGPPEAKKE